MFVSHNLEDEKYDSDYLFIPPYYKSVASTFNRRDVDVNSGDNQLINYSSLLS